jgi:hypothetical protein
MKSKVMISLTQLHEQFHVVPRNGMCPPSYLFTLLHEQFHCNGTLCPPSYLFTLLHEQFHCNGTLCPPSYLFTLLHEQFHCNGTLCPPSYLFTLLHEQFQAITWHCRSSQVKEVFWKGKLTRTEKDINLQIHQHKLLGIHRILFLRDIRLSGYPATPNAGYRISSRILDLATIYLVK